MAKVISEVRQVFASLSNRHEKRRASRALNEVLERITTAMNLNPEFAPFGMTPLPKKEEHPSTSTEPLSGEAQQEIATNSPKKRKKKVSVKRLSPDAVVKRFRLGSTKIACCLDHLGAEGTECQTQGNVIYLNRDHPLYLHAMRKPTTYTMHIARLVTQEITLMKNPSTARQAFLRQSRLLKDAFTDMDPTIGP